MTRALITVGDRVTFVTDGRKHKATVVQVGPGSPKKAMATLVTDETLATVVQPVKALTLR